MPENLLIRPLTEDDPERISAAFAGQGRAETKQIPASAFSDLQCKPPTATSDITDIQQSCYLDPGGESISIYALKTDGNVYLKAGKNIFAGEGGWVVFLHFPIGAIVGFIGMWIFFFFRWLRTIP